MTPSYLKANELTIPGWYWWLPECYLNHPELPENWRIEGWHPEAPGRPKSGLFCGPLEAPVFESEERK